MKNQITILFVLLHLCVVSQSFSQCSCVGCPIFVPNNSIVTSDLPISGLTNGTLGVGGQDVCEVCITLETDAIREIEITLVAPDGSSVILIDRTGGIGVNQNITFDICFVACNDVAMPDAGFSPTFSAQAPWQNNTTYTGTYYPQNGCFEDLTGPANGNWQLVIEDFVVGDPHTITDFSITFCDGTGTTCGPPNPCNPGDLESISPVQVIACEGDAALSLPGLLPIWNGTAPDPSEYGITYLIHDLANNVIERTDNPDLTTFAPGTYFVCGLSYLLADQSLLPPLSGGYTLASVLNDINNAVYCATLSNICSEITINPDIPDPILDWPNPATICAGQDVIIPITNFDPSLTYIFFFNSGSFNTLFFDGNGNLVLNANTGLPVDICVAIDGDCSGQNCIILDVVNGADPPALDAPLGVCVGDDIIVNVTNAQAGDTYTWTVNGPGVITQNNNDNVVVLPNQSTQIEVCATLDGNCGQSTSCIFVEVSEAIDPTILSEPTYCLPSGSIDGNSNGGATSVFWEQISGPGTINFTNPNNLSTTWTADIAGTYIVRLTKEVNGCTTFSEETIEILPAADPPLLDGPTTVCPNERAIINLLNEDPNATYTWSINGPLQIIADNGNSLEIVSLGNSTNAEVCIEATTVCGVFTTCLPVEAILIQPPIVNSPGGFCFPGGFIDGDLNGNPSSTVLYTVINGPGIAIFSDPTNEDTDLSVTVPGIYDLALTKGLDGCDTTTFFSVEVFEEVTVTENIVCNDGQYEVELTFTGGTLPYNIDGVDIAGNTYTSQPIPSGQPLSIIYTDANGCGNTLSYQIICPCVSDAGTMNDLPLSTCDLTESLQGIDNGDAFLDANDASFYVLHTGSNNTLGIIIDINQSGAFSFGPPMVEGTTYYISLVVGDDDGTGNVDLTDPCLSVAIGQPVVWQESPSVSIQLEEPYCDLSGSISLISTLPGDIIWQVTSTPLGGQLFFDNENALSTTLSGNVPGLYDISATVTANGCATTVNVALELIEIITSTPVIEQCNGLEYIVTFDISGGIPPYFVNGLPVTDFTFISNPIASGTNYSFQISDALGCESSLVQGSRNCDCNTDAGSMTGLITQSCGTSGALSATSNDDGFLEADDIGEYILHTNSGATLGTILDRNSLGEFRFLPGMVVGQTYYISYIVGNNAGSVVNLNDLCLDVAPGIPVVWLPPLDIDFDPTYFTCTDTISLLPTGDTSITAFTILEGNGIVNLINNTQFSISEPGNYRIAITANNGLGCIDRDTVELIYSQPVFEFSVSCDTITPTFDLTITMSGGQSPYIFNNRTFEDTLLIENINKDSTVFIQIHDAIGCLSISDTLISNCDCIPQPHTLVNDSVIICDTTEIYAAEVASLSPLFEGQIGRFLLLDSVGSSVQILESDSAGVFAFQPGMQIGRQYYIVYVTASVDSLNDINFADPCISISNSQSITWLVPSVLPELGDTSICGSIISYPRFFGPDELMYQGEPSGDFIINYQDSTVTISTDVSGTKTLRMWIRSDACADTLTWQVEFVPLLTITSVTPTCSSDALTFEASFRLQGSPPFAINGVTYDASPAIVSNLPADEPLIFTVTDNANCNSITDTLSVDCDCPAFPGTINENLITACIMDQIDISYVVDPVLVAGFADVLILHDGNPDSIGNILRIITDGRLTITDDLPVNTVLYISTAVGLFDGVSIDLNDECTIVGMGTPLLIKPRGTVTSNLLSQYCEGDTIQFQINIESTAYPINIQIAWNQVVESLMIGTDTTISYTAMDVQTLNEFVVSSPDLCEEIQLDLEIEVIECTECLSLNIPEDISICNEGSFDLEDLASLQSGPTWQVISGQGTIIPPTTLEIGDRFEGVITLELQPSNSTYCDTIYRVNVSVESIPNGQLITEELLFCEALDTTIILQDLLTPASDKGRWTIQPSIPNFDGISIRLASVQAGFYTLNYVLDTLGECVASDTLKVSLNISPPMEYVLVTTNPDCLGDEGTFSLEIENPALVNTIFINDQAYDDFELIALNSGIYNIDFSDGNRCDYSDGFTIDTATKVIVTIDTTTVQESEPNTYTLAAIANSEDLGRFEWTSNGNPLQSNNSRIQVSISEDTEIAVVFTSDNGCTAEDFILLKVGNTIIPDWELPNVIRPSSSINGLVQIPPHPQVMRINNWIIYDRWGNRVFQAQDFVPAIDQIVWDGSFAGKEVNTGVYVYYIDYQTTDNTTEERIGDITVLR